MAGTRSTGQPLQRALAPVARRVPDPGVALELLKPITWFPPMWAFGCGVVSSGQAFEGRWLPMALGVLLAGPLVCGTSQAVNDWFDREVDAINEPDRPIPSGRMPGRWGLYIALAGTAASVAVAAALGPWVLCAGLLGLALAWAYSAPPLRLKRNGWWGNLAVGLCYEGLAWVTGAAVMVGGQLPGLAILGVALLYSLGAHGIMTLNDFKSIEGDRRCGIGSLPARHGARAAARIAAIAMVVPQGIVIALLITWGFVTAPIVVALLVAAQLALLPRFLRSPREQATWYSATGVSLYVLGMLAAAFALGGAAG